MKTIAIIPARSGSKGLPDKNILELAGKPLIAYTIEAAVKSGCFDEVMVSTDSQKYADIAKSHGAQVPFLRSEENSTDAAGSWDVVREVLIQYQQKGKDFDYVMLLQPTSPLREADDIRKAFQILSEKDAHVVLGVSKVDHPVQWCFPIGEDDSIKGIGDMPYIRSRRQELEPYYRENGSIYLVPAPGILDPDYDIYSDTCYGYQMEREKAVDIDEEIDFIIAEALMNRKKQ